jgi:DNA-nicking Smr family endonuclease|tara:strand:- start:161 stop:580 length:420 start_codon:yes stop_codon:yes gene_type:complete
VSKKKNLSKTDEEIWETYIKNPSDIYDKDKNNQKKKDRKERFRFDLHGHSLNEANQIVRDIIFSCVKKKFKEILFITGKGLHSTSDSDAYVSRDFSKLKYSVPDFIKSDEDLNKFVFSISNADMKDGGEGAILVKLRNL